MCIMHGVWRAHSKVTDHRSAAQHHVVSTKRAQTATEHHRVSHWPTHTHTCPMVVASPAPVPPLVPNLPAAQGPEQADVVSSDVAPNDPAGQALHPDAPARLYCPELQLIQAPARWASKHMEAGRWDRECQGVIDAISIWWCVQESHMDADDVRCHGSDVRPLNN